MGTDGAGVRQEGDVTATRSRKTEDESASPIEIVTRWGLVVLAGISALGAALRVFGPAGTAVSQGLDQTTLLYLGVAGGLLLLRQIKTFSLGQLKLEMIERIRERQETQEERLTELALILPLLLPGSERLHLLNLVQGATRGYHGGQSLRSELRHLADTGLLSRKMGRKIGDMRSEMEFDLADYVELTSSGRRWATRIQQMEATAELELDGA